MYVFAVTVREGKFQAFTWTFQTEKFSLHRSRSQAAGYIYYNRNPRNQKNNHRLVWYTHWAHHELDLGQNSISLLAFISPHFNCGQQGCCESPVHMLTQSHCPVIPGESVDFYYSSAQLPRTVTAEPFGDGQDGLQYKTITSPQHPPSRYSVSRSSQGLWVYDLKGCDIVSWQPNIFFARTLLVKWVMLLFESQDPRD